MGVSDSRASNLPAPSQAAFFSYLHFVRLAYGEYQWLFLPWGSSP